MIKIITTVFIVLALAAVSPAQLIHDSVRVKVAPGVTCPSGWTASTESITVEASYTVRVPASIGGLSFLVSADFVNAVWPTAANKATAIAAGVLEVQAESSSTKNYCSLLAP